MILTNLTGNNMKKKTTKGRKKIEIKKIEETNSRQVTFSKRRTGLFKKASELCILTGAQVAILVNSPGGRVFAFGHPNVEGLIDRYVNGNSSSNNNNTTDGVVNGDNGNNYYPPPLPTKEFNEHYVEVSRELEAEKKRREMIPVASGGGLPWFEADTGGMEVEELEQYLWSLVELKKKVLTRADELMMINKAPGLLCGGGGSSVFEMGWSGFNGGGSTMGVPVNGGVQGGYVFQHGGEAGRF